MIKKEKNVYWLFVNAKNIHVIYFKLPGIFFSYKKLIQCPQNNVLDFNIPDPKQYYTVPKKSKMVPNLIMYPNPQLGI